MVTPRQYDALRLAALGLSDREIADQLGITRDGARMLLRGAYARLRVEGRIDAFRALGWLSVPPERPQMKVAS